MVKWRSLLYGFDDRDLIHIVLGIFPGWLAIMKVISPMQALTLVVIAYWMFRLNMWRKQKELELKEAKAEEAKKKEEEEFLAALPAKKRKNVLKAIAKREELEPSSQEGLSH